jgi:hypothetical protein
MWWVKDEEGATAITVALMLLVIFGIGALVLDAGNLFWERRQLQNAADAAALAAAWDLALGEPEALARESARNYASANSTRGSFVEGFEPDYAAGEVTVRTRTGTEDEAGFLLAWLAGVIGHDTYFTHAQATASWQALGLGETIPLTFSWCEWSYMVGNPADPVFPSSYKVIYHHEGTGKHDQIQKDCQGPAGQYTPGGFGWLDPDDSGKCKAMLFEGWMDGDTGSGTPSPANTTGCTSGYFESLLGETIFLPIFVGEPDGVGSNAKYQIIGFAGFELHGYRLSGGPEWNRAIDGVAVPCKGDARCISGVFTEYVALGDKSDEGGMDLGASVVTLVR